MTQTRDAKKKSIYPPERRRPANNQPEPATSTNPILQLQRAVGNQAVARLLNRRANPGINESQREHQALRSPVLQTKLTLSQPGDHLEQAADRIAERLASPAPPANVPMPTSASNKSFQARVETNLGIEPGSVRLHTDEQANRAARSANARAFTVGNDVVFGRNEYAPDTREGQHLLAHELVHVAQQRETSGAANTLMRAPDPARSNLPWIGRIAHTSSASLRKTPAKDPDDPHGNTLADLPEDTEVQVVGSKGGWMQVQVDLEGKTLSGYVSTELITYVSAGKSLFHDPGVMNIKFPSVAEAFVELKRAEKRKAKEGPAFKPTDDEQGRINRAIVVLNGTSKYIVNETTFEVDFVAQAGKEKTKVTTIEDFILFVEQVEKQYPSASPQEVASEVRQLWFSDTNWEILAASSGISQDGNEVDIETEPNPIASRFNMKQVAPTRGSLQLDTRMGRVDIGHVMSGIDLRLSGAPSDYAASMHGKTPDYSDDERMLKFVTMMNASGGRTLDFATWAGDLGQAYGEYLVDRYVKGNASASLKTFAADKAPPDELLGDIHGYIAVSVYKKVPASVSPTGMEIKVSNILRDMYLVDKPAASTSQAYLEQVSGKSSSDLKPFITERSLAFARPWFAKKAYEHRGKWSSKGWSPGGILENAMQEFDEKHIENETDAAAENKLGTLVDGFLKGLSAPVK